MFSESERALLDTALRIAIAQWKRDAGSMRYSGQHRVADQFERQAAEAEELILKIEAA